MTNNSNDGRWQGVPGDVLHSLRAARRAVVFGHTRPDGDVLGTQVGLAWALRGLGCEVRLLNPDLPESQFSYLEPPSPFERFEGPSIPECDLAVMVDGNELARAGELGLAVAGSAAQRMVIDHHLLPAERWWDLALIDRTASATGLIVLRLIDALGLGLRREQAVGLFTAIATDTGWFRHPSTDPETLLAAARLVEAGADPDRVHRCLYRSRSDRHPRDLAALLDGARLSAGGRIAYLEVPYDPLRDLGAADVALELMRSVAGVEVVVQLRELGPTHTKLSLRSDGALDVHGLAAGFGGGGHRKAAGAELMLPLAAARSKIIAAAEALLDDSPSSGGS
jgi:phosphoesterase RecJ-like protein